jgi:hypothetical protein
MTAMSLMLHTVKVSAKNTQPTEFLLCGSDEYALFLGTLATTYIIKQLAP